MAQASGAACSARGLVTGLGGLARAVVPRRTLPTGVAAIAAATVGVVALATPCAATA